MDNQTQTPNVSENSPEETSPNSGATSYSPASQQKPSKKRKILIAVTMLVVILVAAGAVYWFMLKDKKAAPTNSTQTKSQTTQKPEVSQQQVDAALAKFIKPTTGETWLATPKKIAKLDYLKEDQYSSPSEYYEVGKHGDKTIQMSVVQELGDNISLYERDSQGNITLIAHPDGDAVYNEDNEKSFGDVYASKIKIDKSIHYDSLTLPRQLDLDKGYKLGKPSYPSLGDLIRPEDTAPSKKTELKKLGSSTLYQNEYLNADTKLTSISYSVQTPLQTSLSLTYEPLETKLDGYQWQSGSSPSDNIRAIAQGCGGKFSAVTRSENLTDNDVQPVGKSPSGQTVYELKDTRNPLFQKAYDEFKEFNADYADSEFPNISQADFAKEHAVIVYKDKFGQWLVYIRDKLAAVGGCAKPVVYLYPQQTESVNVRVGANVKVSDPLYDPLVGWKNVIAKPNGSLLYNGQSYSSLFWEGPGIGSYPAITSGTVVRASDAAATIHAQLKQLGLNATETNDFESYWKDKLPTSKPYVRLTWLTTAEMNRLAPLSISPTPDTIIRVFLDFNGLDAPLKLPPQQLSSIPRQGFTVVEWGGLSHTRLY
jgi:hypothetical protein